MSMKHTDEHMEKLPDSNVNPYVKLIRLSKEDIERNTAHNHKKENTSTLLNQWNTPTGFIKQEFIVEDTNMEIYRTTIEHTSWQSTVQTFGTNVKMEPTDIIEVKTEQENRIRTIIEGSTAFSNYMENVNRTEFICQVCQDNFDNYEEYIVHKNLIHKSKPFVCKVCNAKFVLNAHLNIHLAEHVDDVCMLNSSVSPSEIQSSSKSNLTINSNRNYKNSKLTSKLAKKCCNTSISINVSNNFTQNLSVTDPNTTLQKNKCKAFKCVNCVFSTGSETKFLNHHDICNNTSKGSAKFYQCNLCIKTFTTRSGLNGHLKYHTFRSEMISRRQLALNKQKLKNQIKNSSVKSQKYVFPKIANFNRSHKCKDCNKHFTTRSKLNIHCKQHRQQMICNICHKKFLLKKNFENHLLSHTNVIISNGISNDTLFNESNSQQNQNAIKRPGDKSENQNISKLFHCSYCNKSYKSKQSLSQHNRQHHSRFKLPRRKLKSKTVECNWCSLVITKCNLLRHIKSLHPDINPIQCLHCPMAFKDSPSLKLHTSRCHTA
ncbi:zinc finger protein 544 [Acyrthosiphon pisum]|uniref:C2H2-type domain-containing protein n=1 Tax=Acyrthosiphon pisum TaxID=7029 RepID=A0A8R2A6G1_ACYPI|nr:zinc finger protein 544 [Acyrthosiphon pisum]|eukprot:XP_001948795.2 PREDICTED: zinc finger protein 544 [Acyrthosiphon pisum]